MNPARARDIELLANVDQKLAVARREAAIVAGHRHEVGRLEAARSQILSRLQAGAPTNPREDT